MNPEEITQLVTILVAVGGTLAPVVFWAIEALIKPFIKDTRKLPFFAIVLGGIIGAVVPFLLTAFSLGTVPMIGSVVAGIIGGAIAMKTYDKGVQEGLKKGEGEDTDGN